MTAEITPSAITGGLITTFIGQNVRYYPSLPSTMDQARQEIRRGAKAGTVIIAGEQTGGRGRLKRAWLSPHGNIALSVILYPDIADLPFLIMIASLAVAQSIEAVAGVKTQIKWPNDILIEGKKVAGILIENEVKGKKVDFSIVGIGINIELQVADHAEIANTAASLKNASNQDNLRLKIIRSLLTEFERLYRQLPEGKPIFEAWRDRLVTLGKKVRATSGNRTIEGIGEDVDESGALMIRGADGTVTKVVAGDVTLRV
jgi:BirA family transcriptional regulator, biotin operon repressor / biotin---[acetyl-CoA-carboxylase] ligase